MDRKYTASDCELYGTHECELLNMESCENCPLTHADGETPQQLREAAVAFERLMPEEGIACFFETKECCFCRENRGKKNGYAVFSMAHPEPKHEKSVLVKKWKVRSPVGSMAIIQAGICKSCRVRLLALEYLPTLMTVLLGGLGLLLLTRDAIAVPLEKTAGWLPFLCWVTLTVGGWGLGKLLVTLLKKRFDRTMLTDFTEHPVIREMLNKGWFTLPQGKPLHYVFSKKRSRHGLGTAPSSVYRKPETEENA